MAFLDTPQSRASWNRRNLFDPGLDLLRSRGLNQKQFSNLQGGKLPGGMRGLFVGMTPAQLKQIAGLVDAQGVQQDTNKIDPITGAPIQQMHFNYTDPRLQHGEDASAASAVAPWLQQAMQGQGGGILPGRTVGGGMGGGNGRYTPPPGREYTGLGAHGYGRGLHGMAPGTWRAVMGNGPGGGFPVRRPPILGGQTGGGQLPFRTLQGGGLRSQLIAQAMRNAGR